MRFRLDETFGRSAQRIFQAAGHDACTVHDEGLLGAPDPDVLSAATREGRVLVTLYDDFGNVLLYRHDESAGVAVINPPGQVSMPLLRLLIRTLLEALGRDEIRGRLWVVEPGRVREHEPRELPGREELE